MLKGINNMAADIHYINKIKKFAVDENNISCLEADDNNTCMHKLCQIHNWTVSRGEIIDTPMMVDTLVDIYEHMYKHEVVTTKKINNDVSIKVRTKQCLDMKSIKPFFVHINYVLDNIHVHKTKILITTFINLLMYVIVHNGVSDEHNIAMVLRELVKRKYNGEHTIKTILPSFYLKIQMLRSMKHLINNYLNDDINNVEECIKTIDPGFNRLIEQLVSGIGG